jgi:hypothetical protein
VSNYPGGSPNEVYGVSCLYSNTYSTYILRPRLVEQGVSFKLWKLQYNQHFSKMKVAQYATRTLRVGVDRLEPGRSCILVGIPEQIAVPSPNVRAGPSRRLARTLRAGFIVSIIHS